MPDPFNFDVLKLDAESINTLDKAQITPEILGRMTTDQCDIFLSPILPPESIRLLKNAIWTKIDAEQPLNLPASEHLDDFWGKRGIDRTGINRVFAAHFKFGDNSDNSDNNLNVLLKIKTATQFNFFF